MGTTFASVYHRFLGKITDDLYVELTPEDTIKDLRNLLLDAIPHFEFPRINLYDYVIAEAIKPTEEVNEETDFVLSEAAKGHVVIENSSFSMELSQEEINIIAIDMVSSWLQRQIASIENTRMKYSGSDFKFTSQANHLQKLLTTKDRMLQESHHMQRLYKRRKVSDEGRYKSNWSVFGASAID